MIMIIIALPPLLPRQTRTSERLRLREAAAAGERWASVTRSLLQRRGDLDFGVPWSRHFVTCLQQLSDACLLLGPSAVKYNPHFLFFASSYSRCATLGAVQDWPAVNALLLLDLIAPDLRQDWLQRASQHSHPVWILRLHHPSKAAPMDLRTLSSLQAQCVALVPAKSKMLHAPGYWETAEWDEQPSHHPAQLWLMDGPTRSRGASAHFSVLCSASLGDWTGRRYDFHSCSGPCTKCPSFISSSSTRRAPVFVPGISGRHEWECGYTHGENGGRLRNWLGRLPLLTISAQVGGPFSPLRAEAVSLLEYLRRVRAQFPEQRALLIFIDCLVLLIILMKWGRSEFQPHPCEIVHFDVLVPLLSELRKWPGSVLLVKVKSHGGCLLNDRADELADQGLTSQDYFLARRSTELSGYAFATPGDAGSKGKSSIR
jgi:hypothetical protein